MMKFSLQNNKASWSAKADKMRVLSLAALMTVSLSSFSQNKSKGIKPSSERVELNYKQRHSKVAGNNQLYADGIKIKRDLTILKEIQEQRILNSDEIPAEELYGGIWVNNHVNAYSNVKEAPDTFKVDLTNFTIPTTGYITSKFGKRQRRMHYGIDLKVQVGDTIYAAFDGKVRIKQFERRGYGNYLVIRHPNGLETVYGHLSGFLVDVDDVVKSGEPIALGGNTGRSTGSHLHLEFRYMGKPIDPTEIVDFENKVCHKDSYLITPETFAVSGSRYANPSTLATRKSNTPNKYAKGEVTYHRIKSGDTLSNIARRYNVSIAQLCKINNISKTTVLKAGKSIRIS